MARYLDRAERTVRKRLKKVPDGEGHAEALHRARKAAKRARYVAEMSEPELGGRARGQREEVQEDPAAAR